ncbi:MAG: hypothetical protein QXJ74_01780 [Nitrososphaera sp.]
MNPDGLGEHRNKVKFSITDAGLEIPSHDLLVTKYLIDIRTDQFMEVSIADFIRYFPECKALEFVSSRKSLTWKQVCSFIKRVYDGKTITAMQAGEEPAAHDSYELGIIEPRREIKLDEPSFSQSLGSYTQRIYSHSKQFCKTLGSVLPKRARVLDLGSSNEPWFSYLCALNGLQVFALDIHKPPSTIYDKIREAGITYIYDDINNIDRYKQRLHNLDFIYCRNLHPAQTVWEWRDPDFTRIWKTLLSMLSNRGVIYWIQMTSGADKMDIGFANRGAKYFKEYFAELGADVKITKYGYMVLKVGRPLHNAWKKFEVPGPTKEKQDLLKSGDYASLLKWYTLQLQPFYEANNFEMNFKIEIYAEEIPAKILRTILLENFRYYDAVIAGESSEPRIRISGQDADFTLSNVGYTQDAYFLIDQQEDEKFTSEYLTIANVVKAGEITS